MFANAKTMEETLPLSERDFAVFQATRIEYQSTRKVAARFGMSQARVRQIVARVVDFLLREGPGDLSEVNRERRIHAAEGLARAQLEYLYLQAMEQWYKSRQPRQGRQGASLGRVCYLMAAARISSLLAKLPNHPLPELRAETEEQGEQAEAAEENPLVRDCAAKGVRRGRVAEFDLGATDCRKMGYDV
ncbi:MAG: hypothetical protein SFU86_00965 [Pirellulaceae bacterium]|nr:hypothetical protein [Pirellulaceae bacterium]